MRSSDRSTVDVRGRRFWIIVTQSHDDRGALRAVIAVELGGGHQSAGVARIANSPPTTRANMARELRALIECLHEQLDFTTKNKGDVQIEWTDDDEAIVRTVATSPDLIGSITFRHIEGVDHHDEGHFVVTNLRLDGPNGSSYYVKQGIGQEIISSISIAVTFHVDDGKRRDDGGHLTGDGPVFVRKMVAKGVAH